MKKKHFLISLLLLFSTILLFSSCQNSPQDNIVTPPTNNDIKINDLIISRIYSNSNCKFFAITNTTTHDIDLTKVKIVLTPEVNALGKFISLPEGKLCGSKTIFCLNGYSKPYEWESYGNLKNMPVIEESTSSTIISEDSVWYGIKGNYTNSSFSIVANNGDNRLLKTIDTSIPMQKPCSYLRAFSQGRDNGWFKLNPTDDTDKQTVISGIHTGTPEIKPVNRIPDIIVSDDTTPDTGNNDNPVNPGIGKNTIKSDNIALGIPNYVDGTEYKDHNTIFDYDSFYSSFNDLTHNPNWISWHFTPYDSKSKSRNFAPEMNISEENRTYHEDYDASDCAYKYNRGHMCPNGDRTGFPGNGTYIMTNIVPQDIKVNSGIWASFENEMRNIAADKNNRKEYFSVAGPSIQSDGEFIGKKSQLSIQIPSYTWRVVIITDLQDGNDLERINANKANYIDAYAIWIPNDINKVSGSWRDYLVSIDFVEEKTGIDFFSALNDEIEKSLESKNANSKAELKFKDI